MQIEYDVFLSFVDKDRFLLFKRGRSVRRVDVVRELKKALESHTIPTGQSSATDLTEYRQNRIRHWFRNNGFRVCTDAEDFELDETVSAAIQKRIHVSGNLLVLISENAPKSRWVNTELELFSESNDRPPLSARLGDVNPDQAFPSYFRKDALAANLTRKPGMTIKAWRQQLVAESHKIVAEALNMPLKSVYNRFRQQKRKRLLTRVVILLVVVALAFWGAVASANAWRLQQRRAKHTQALSSLLEAGWGMNRNAQGWIARYRVFSAEDILYPDRSDCDTLLLSALQDVEDLHTLDLAGSPIADSNIDSITGISTLQRLFLSQTKVTDQAMPSLNALTKLHYLRLGSNVTDQGLSMLKGMHQLNMLDLEGQGITNEVLKVLAEISVKDLVLIDTSITEQAISDFSRSHPDIRIRIGKRDQPALNSVQVHEPQKAFQTAVVKVQDLGKAQYFHSGFFISPNGHILTTYFSTARSVSVEMSNGRKLEAEPVVMQRNDFSILKVDVQAVPYLSLDEEPAKLGQKVFSLGFGWPHGLRSFPATVVDIERSWLLLERQQSQLAGVEGGPVVGENGQIVGMHLGGFQGMTRVGKANVLKDRLVSALLNGSVFQDGRSWD